MSSVEDRIVNMKFDNKQFTQGATDSQKSLQSLEQTLAKTAQGKGLSTMGSSVDQVSGKFSAMKIAGITAVATIASKATTAGLDMLKGLTVGPLLAGFHEYETNLNSIQTIMANTGKKVSVVNKYLGQLNEYSDRTIYNFSQMADSIGKFTAAGVPLKEATSSIKGMANMAALSGSNVQQLNTAMYQMSQALSTGTIKLMDWNSLANAGMGGSNIREALMATNRTLGDNGELMDSSIKKMGSFRDSLQTGWLTAETFNKTMKVMAGTTNKAGETVAFTVEQLKGMGYSTQAAEQLHKLSQASIDSATKIKTFSQLVDVVKESIGSGWAKIFQDLFGNFTEASKLWTNVGESITGTVGGIFDSVDEMLLGWKELGGFQDLWTGFGNIFKTIGNLISPFVAAFKTLLPSTGQAGSNLAAATSAFATFTGWMEKASRGAVAITPVLETVFGIFKKFGAIAGAVISGLAPLLPILHNVAEAVGDLSAQGASIGAGIIGGILQGLDVSQIQQAVTQFATNIVTWIKGALGIHSPATELIPVGVNIVEGIVEGILKAIPGILDAMGRIIVAVFSGVKDLFSGLDAMDWAGIFNAILTGGVLIALKKGIDATTSFKDVLGSAVGVIDEVGNSLKAWQASLKAKMILEIAIAVGILSASVIALSMVDPKKLAVGLGAITAMMGTLAGTLLALSKIESDKQMAILATSFILISTAMIALAQAAIMLGDQDPKKLAQGIGAIAAMLGLLVGTMFLFSKIQGSIEGMAASMLILSLAMNLLAAAVLALGSMDVKTLSKGLGAMAIGLGLMVGSLLLLSTMKGSIEGAAGSIFIMSAAMVILSTAVLAFGHMDIKTMAKGFGAVAVALGLFTAALVILGGNTAGTLAAAGAILVMAMSFALLVPVIATLGSMDMGTLVKGLAALAVVMVLFVAAIAALGYVAMVVGPGLLILGASLALVGVGMLAFGTGFALMAATGVAGVAVLIAAFHAFLALLPAIAQQLAWAFVAFLKVLANALPKVREAMDKIMTELLGIVADNIPKIVALVVLFVSELLKGITKLIPDFGRLISQLIKTGLDVIKKAVPQYVDAGAYIVEKVLEGLGNRMPGILDAAGDLIVVFIKGLGKQANKVIDAAGQTILKFLDGLDKAVVKYSGPITEKGVAIAGHLIQGVYNGLTSSGAIGKIKSAVDFLAGLIPDKLAGALGIDSPSKVMIPIGGYIVDGVAKGIVKRTSSAVAAVVAMANAIIAEGNKAVLKAQKTAQKLQSKAYAAQARADLKAEEAQAAAKFAQQHKKDKAAQKRAKALQKQADASQKAADKAQSEADRAAQRVSDVQAFQEADLTGKGDIKNQQAVVLADRASQMLAKANAEATRARELMKTNRKAGLALLAQSKRDAAAAKKLAQQAAQAHAEANRFYAAQVNDRIKQLKATAAADAKARRDQAAFDAADSQGKSDILTKRAEANEKRAKAAQKLAQQLMAQAKRLAKTDAKRANRLLDKAERLAQEARDAADEAEQQREEAKSVLSQGNTGTGGGGTVTPSRTALEDAAKSIDRYTKSLQEAESLAMTQQGVIQFVQNNHSPESLSEAEIYRQSKNLLSSAELKMAAG